MVNYFIFANLYLLLFYALYLWTLKNSSNYRWSRFYLLSSVSAALSLPFVRINLSLFPSTDEGIVRQAIQMPEVVLQTAQTSKLSYVSWFPALYVVVATLLLLRLANQSLNLYLFFKKQHFTDYGRYRIALNTGQGPASFGRAIVFPDSEVNDMVLRHEIAHALYKHHCDKMFIRILECLFFPVLALKLVGTELGLVHEFEADKSASNDINAYSLLLIGHHFKINPTQLLQSFFHHPLKRRIMMLQKSRKDKKVLLMSAFLLTVTGVILLQSQSPVMAQKKKSIILSEQPAVKEKIYTSVDHMPEATVDFGKYLYENFKTPERAKNDTLKGLVVAQFIVGKDGKVRDARIMRSLRADIDQEVLRVINSLPYWKPGMHDGKAVAVYYTVPFRFKAS